LPLKDDQGCRQHGVSEADAVGYYGLLHEGGLEAARIAFPEFARGLREQCPVCQLMHAHAFGRSEFGSLF
jgi:hypothetical protein